MFECIVLQFALAYNITTTETFKLYRCQGSSEFNYVDRDKKFEGVYDINNNVFIITNDNGCI